LFADSQQIIVELKHYIHDFEYGEADLAFISSKIFNSEYSLLDFLCKNLTENDKLVAGIKKRIFELIVGFVEAHPEVILPYIEQLRTSCMRSLISDSNSLVKESAI
jgi:hypothetical protein